MGLVLGLVLTYWLGPPDRSLLLVALLRFLARATSEANFVAALISDPDVYTIISHIRIHATPSSPVDLPRLHAHKDPVGGFPRPGMDRMCISGGWDWSCCFDIIRGESKKKGDEGFPHLLKSKDGGEQSTHRQERISIRVVYLSIDGNEICCLVARTFTLANDSSSRICMRAWYK